MSKLKPYTVTGIVVEHGYTVTFVPDTVHNGHVARSKVPRGQWGAQTYATSKAAAIIRAEVLWEQYLNGIITRVEVIQDRPRRRWPWSRRGAQPAPVAAEIF